MGKIFKVADVSEHNNVTSFKNVDAVMIRCGYGFDNQDKKVIKHIELAKKEKKPFGFYFYSYACTLAESDLEKRWLIDFIKKYKPELPVTIDMEDADGYKVRHGNPNKETLTKICLNLLNAVESAGYYAQLYCNVDWWLNRLESPKLRKFDLWIASWGVSVKPDVSDAEYMWQYTSSANVDGLGSRVDMSNAYVNYPQIIKAKGLNGWKKKDTSLKVGDKVKVKKAINYDTGKPFAVYYKNYDVLEIKGERVVIGIGKTVTSAIDIDNIEKL